MDTSCAVSITSSQGLKFVTYMQVPNQQASESPHQFIYISSSTLLGFAEDSLKANEIEYLYLC